MDSGIRAMELRLSATSVVACLAIVLTNVAWGQFGGNDGTTQADSLMPQAPCVRLPWVISDPPTDAAQERFWDERAEAVPIDLSPVLPQRSLAVRSSSRYAFPVVAPVLAPVKPSNPFPQVALRALPSPPETGFGPLPAEVPPEAGVWEEQVRTGAFSSGPQQEWQVPGSSLWGASQQAEERLQEAFALAEKGAVFAAREEFESAMRIISQAMDARDGMQDHVTALSEGLLALDEASDFLKEAKGRQSAPELVEIANRHRSGAAGDEDLSGFDANRLAELYFRHAERQLAAAAGGSPMAATCLYGLGRFWMLRGEQQPARAALENGRAMACFRASLEVDPSNPWSGNELGVLMARQGRLIEARDILWQSVRVHPSRDSWRNLATVQERLGEFEQASRSHWESQRAAALAQNQSPVRAPVPGGSTVYWVDKSTFEHGVGVRTAVPGNSGSLQTRRPPPSAAWVR